MLFSGTFHTALNNPLPIWSETAHKVFTYVKGGQFVQKKGIYDKVIIDCAFREDLSRKKLPDSKGGCEGF